MRNKILILVGVITLFIAGIIFGGRKAFVFAAEGEKTNSASIEKQNEVDNFGRFLKRRAKLERFLKRYNSPLLKSLDDIINASDNCGMRPELMIAISGVESTFGQNYPVWSNNPLGWGIYGNQVLSYPSLGKAFEAAACGITQKYPVDAQTNIEKLATIYNGVTPYSWSNKIRFFLTEIEKTSSNPDTLTVSL